MSKERPNFAAPEPDLIEDVDSPNFTKDVHQTDEEFYEPFVFTPNHAFTIIVLFAGYLADQFIADLTHQIYSTIVNDIGPAPQNFLWILSIPTLVGGILAPITGRASDMFGRKHLQLAASIFGIIGSAIAVRTDSMKVLMVSSAIYGIGYAGHQLALTSIVEILPRKYRAITIGLFMGARIPADGFSPLIGAAITLHSSWRVIYWLALGLYLFSFIGTFLLYHPEKLAAQEAESFGKRLIQFDYIGMFLTIGGIMTVAVGLIFGGTVFPWKSVGTLVPTFLGVIVIIVLVSWVVLNRLRYPFIPRALKLDYWSMWACIFFIGMVSSTTNGLWPTQAQILYAQNAIPLGLFTTPYGLAGCLFAPIAGFLFFPKHARWILTGYSTVYCIAVGAQAVVGTHTAAGSTVLVGLNGAMHGATVVVTTAMVQLTVKHEDLGIATNLAFSAFTFGGVAYGIIDQIIVHNKLKEETLKLIVPALVRAGIPLIQLPAAVPAFLAGEITNPIFANVSPTGLFAAGEALKEAYIDVFRFIYLVSILFGGVLVLLSVLQKNLNIPITSQVDARLRSPSSLLPARKRQF